MVKHVRPGALVTDTCPWWAAVTASTMASPSPVLPAARDLEESPRTNRSNRVGTSSAGIPGPSSLTVTATHEPSGAPGPGTAASPTVTVVPAAHHGQVSVTSAPGRTRFTITLPRLPGDLAGGRPG